MIGDFDYGTLTLEKRKEIHDAMAATTVKHISRSNGFFDVMPFDMAQSPSQMLEVVHLESVPAELSELDFLARAVNADLLEACRKVLRDQPAYLGAAKYLLNVKRDNIVNVTTHGNIDDIAVWQVAETEVMELDNWRDRSGLVLSRGITTIQAFGMAGSEVVQKGGHGFLSFQRTPTMDALGIDPELMQTNNRNMRHEVRRWMNVGMPKIARRSGGKILNTAWEGKTMEVDYGDDHKPSAIRLHKIGHGTIDMIKYAAVQPVTIWDGDEPVVIMGELTEVKNKRDAVRVQNWQRETLASIVGISVDKISVIK